MKSQGGVPYGRFWIGKQRIAAHRYALSTKLGRPLARGKLACHTCDVPLCCNPAHLYEGTTSTNARDRDSRKRRDRRPGERHHNAHLTEADVLAIRAAYAAGGSGHRGRRGDVTHGTLAEEYGVSAKEIGKIVRGERWAHL